MTSACSLSNSFAAIFITPVSTIIITITAEIYANAAWVRTAKLSLTACWYLHFCNIKSFTNDEHPIYITKFIIKGSLPLLALKPNKSFDYIKWKN